MKANMDKRKMLMILAIVALAGFTVFVIVGGKDYAERILIGLAISIVLAVSLNLFSGFTGLFSLGQVGFMAIGAYASSILTLPLAMKAANLPDLPVWLASIEMPFLPATLLAGSLAACVAFLVGIPLMRLIGPYVSVATMGFLVITQVVLTNADTFTRGSRTFAGVSGHTTLLNAWLWAAISVYFVLRMKYSSFGRAMRASRDNVIAAQSIGIDVVRQRLLAFCASAFLTAVGGALWAHFIRAFSPKSFYFTQTFSVITMVVIGGLGSVRGSILGVFFVTILSEVLRNLERGFSLGPVTVPSMYGASQVIMALILILIIVFRPGGMMGESETSLEALVKRFRKAGTKAGLKKE